MWTKHTATDTTHQQKEYVEKYTHQSPKNAITNKVDTLFRSVNDQQQHCNSTQTAQL